MGKDNLLDSKAGSESNGADPRNVPILRFTSRATDDRGPNGGPGVPAPETVEPRDLNLAHLRTSLGRKDPFNLPRGKSNRPSLTRTSSDTRVESNRTYR